MPAIHIQRISCVVKVRREETKSKEEKWGRSGWQGQSNPFHILVSANESTVTYLMLDICWLSLHGAGSASQRESVTVAVHLSAAGRYPVPRLRNSLGEEVLSHLQLRRGCPHIQRVRGHARRSLTVHCHVKPSITLHFVLLVQYGRYLVHLKHVRLVSPFCQGCHAKFLEPSLIAPTHQSCS